MPIQKGRQPVLLSLHLKMVSIELHNHMPLQGPEFYISLESGSCSFVAYYHEFRNRELQIRRCICCARWKRILKTLIWPINPRTELPKSALFTKLFVATNIEILRNTLSNVSRDIESDNVCTKVLGSVSKCILRSGGSWHPISSSMPKNKRNVSLVISELAPAFCLFYNLVQPTITSSDASSKNDSKSLRRVPISFSLLNFGMFAFSATLLSRFFSLHI